MAVKPHLNEIGLLSKIAAGDQSAFTTLFYHYYKPLGRFIFNITRSPQLTEEIVQDAFVKIWMRKENLSAIKSFGNYIFVLCRNEAFAQLKKIASEKNAITQLEHYLAVEAEHDQLENHTEVYRNMIAEAVAKLPPQQKRVYQLSRHDRLKYGEIADQLGLSEVTVKKHIQLAVQFIQQDVNARMSLGFLLVFTTPFILR